MKSFSEVLESLRAAEQISKKDLADKAKLTPGYISLLTRGEREAPSSTVVTALADALNLDETRRRELFDAAGHPFVPTSSSPTDTTIHRGIAIYQIDKKIDDGGEAPFDSLFYGRERELETLERWIVEDNCHIVTVLGVGGVGKSTLSAKLAKHIEDDFDYIFWRSLQNAPSLQTILEKCIVYFSDQRKTDLPASEYEQISLLISYLRYHRCLLILDNFESVLQANDRTGQYRKEYEGYGHLLERLGETNHQSCLLINSREKPKEIARLEGATLFIRSLELPGITMKDAKEILRHEGIYAQNNEDWQQFIHLYAGNPLALKLVSASIRELFGGNIALFLQEGEPIFGDIYALLEQQFNRLSEPERRTMYWFAIEEDAVTLSDLRDDLVPPMPMKDLQEALNSLRRRSIVNINEGGRFTVDQAIKQYIVDRLVQEVCQELDAKQPRLLQSHALMKAQAKDYVREGQIHLIVKPIMEHLLTTYGQEQSQQRLYDILTRFRDQHQQTQMPFPGDYLAGNILNLLIQMKCDVCGADFSLFAVWQAYLQGVLLQRVDFAGADLAKSVFTDSFGSIHSVALSPNGVYLAAGTMNGEVRIWETANGQPVDTFTWHSDWVRSVAFSPDGNYLASGSSDQTICIQDRNTGNVRRISGDIGRIYSIAFSPDSHYLVSGGRDAIVRLWDVQSGESLQSFFGHQNRIWSVAYSRDNRIASSGEDKTIRIWDMPSGKCIHVLEGHQAPIWSIAFQLDGKLLASGSEDQTIRLWNTTSWQCERVLEGDRNQGHTNWVRAVTFDLDGKTVISGSDDCTVRLWEVATGKCRRTLRGHTNWVRTVAISRDGTVLASGSEDQTVRIWELGSDQCRKTLQGHSTSTYSIAFSPDGKWLASSDEDQSVYLWNVMTRTLRIKLPGHQNWIRSFAFSRDGKYLASASEDRTVRVWEPYTGRLAHILTHDDWVYSVAFSPDSRFLASGSEDQMVRIWDVSSGQQVRVLPGHTDWVTAVSFSPDGRFLASGGDDQFIRLWDVATGKLYKSLPNRKGRIYFVCFSPDGRFLITGGEDAELSVWQVSTATLAYSIQDPASAIHYAIFRPDGEVIASVNEDNIIRIWDTTSASCLYQFQEQGKVTCVSYTPDSSFLAISNDDGTIKLLDAHTYQYLDELRGERPYEKMNIKGVKGLTIAQKEKLMVLGAIE